MRIGYSAVVYRMDSWLDGVMYSNKTQPNEITVDSFLQTLDVKRCEESRWLSFIRRVVKALVAYV
ncbi:hypothetical protein JOD55_000990 [Arcanobacterium pluranimalium]|nr:hypothetical protein [Arcanobacterium pluranimalium]